ncbi:OSTP protein, partial [Smithornis capensis]|nr:OSTP protein [Smithornis capensis]
MKVAVLCLCLISITAAWPVSKSQMHVTNLLPYFLCILDPRGHHLHRYYHEHVNSQSWESQQHPQNDLESPQQVQETNWKREQSIFPCQDLQDSPDVSSKSHEDVDDDDDDNDSNDTDESDEIVTGFPTDIPVTVPFPPFTRGDNAGRGDSVAYRMRAKAALVKSSKFRKAAKKV